MFIANLKTLTAAASLTAANLLTAILSTTPDCSTADSSLHCRLLTWLNMLEATAGVLGFLLIVAAIFAFVAFHRNKTRKLEKRRSK